MYKRNEHIVAFPDSLLSYSIRTIEHYIMQVQKSCQCKAVQTKQRMTEITSNMNHTLFVRFVNEVLRKILWKHTYLFQFRKWEHLGPGTILTISILHLRISI